MTILDLPPQARPRERLAESGAAALSCIELIAILLGSGTKARSALQLAADLLIRFKTLEALAEATLQELLQVRGIGFAKAVQLQAAFAISKKLSTHAVVRSIETPADAFLELSPLLADEKTEVLYVLLRDVRRNLIHKEEIGRGILNHLIIHPREVFCPAIRHRAQSIIIAHNHPSGDCAPSRADLDATQAIYAASKVIGIPLIDHLIIGKGSFFSFQQKGLLERTLY